MADLKGILSGIGGAAAGASPYATAALTGYSLLKSLFGKKSAEEKAQEAAKKRLAQIAERGLDPAMLNRALAIQNAQRETDKSGLLSRLAAQGVGGGLAEEALGALQRRRALDEGNVRGVFNERSEAAKLAATQQLAGAAPDNSLSELLSASLNALQASRRPKSDALTTDDVAKIMKGRNDYPMSTDFDYGAPRGSSLSPRLSPQIPQPGYYDAPLRLNKKYPQLRLG